MTNREATMNEAELIDWFSKHSVSSQFHNGKPCWKLYTHELCALFAGKKLVDAGAVVLSVEDARELLRLLPNSSASSHAQLLLRERASAAIKQEGGSDGS